MDQGLGGRQTGDRCALQLSDWRGELQLEICVSLWLSSNWGTQTRVHTHTHTHTQWWCCSTWPFLPISFCRKKWFIRRRSQFSPWRRQSFANQQFWCFRSGTTTALPPTTSLVRHKVRTIIDFIKKHLFYFQLCFFINIINLTYLEISFHSSFILSFFMFDYNLSLWWKLFFQKGLREHKSQAASQNT